MCLDFCLLPLFNPFYVNPSPTVLSYGRVVPRQAAWGGFYDWFGRGPRLQPVYVDSGCHSFRRGPVGRSFDVRPSFNSCDGRGSLSGGRVVPGIGLRRW